MNSPPGAKIITLSTTLLLSISSLASAQTPTIRDSQILPYILDNPNENSLVRVRCVPNYRQDAERNRRIIRDTLLRPTQSEQTVTIEIEGSCRNVRISIPEDTQFFDFPVNNSDLDNSWLTRPGSGWYWFHHGR
ncbi:hypothetical protein HCG51_26920 [Tolypothrix sp. PCC 7910]|uniref:hypothetical protein n=1 Tax=Tolypothrix sp. PCC 7910 TaxID=2099387 RepID=UPI0014278DFD|nr:hypothetical protein [Tolypothrix sp. PCC 7910]QIR39977.1 hypothetical protein HCG51_26920 [Tolypothrix sp. PCC 7910]